jgi:DNA-binding NarL/FixJ family response regulator
MAMIRVVLVGNAPVVRLGVRTLLENASGIAVVGETSDGEEAPQVVKSLAPDVVLIDTATLGAGEGRLVQQLRTTTPSIHILVLGPTGYEQGILEIINRGAAGYLAKDAALDAIVEAVRGIVREGCWVSPKVAAQMMRCAFSHQLKPQLTAREIDVLRLIALGKTDNCISRSLSISERTVRYHLQNIYDKLHVSRRGEAIAWAVRAGFAE